MLRYWDERFFINYFLLIGKSHLIAVEEKSVTYIFQRGFLYWQHQCSFSTFNWKINDIFIFYLFNLNNVMLYKSVISYNGLFLIGNLIVYFPRLIVNNKLGKYSLQSISYVYFGQDSVCFPCRNIITSIAALTENPFRRTSEHNHSYNQLNFSLFTRNNPFFY